jgi:hypothetical protein
VLFLVCMDSVRVNTKFLETNYTWKCRDLIVAIQEDQVAKLGNVNAVSMARERSQCCGLSIPALCEVCKLNRIFCGNY